jgi:hypothetical protein
MVKDKEKELMGAHWDNVNVSMPYKLARRVETVAKQLAERRTKGWQPLREHIEELDDIATKIEVYTVEKKMRHLNKK